MVNKIEKPSRERRLLSGGLVALTVALALVASLLYAQPVIRAYWWIAAVAAPHRGPRRDPADKGNRAPQPGSLIAHLPRSARLETQLKPFLCPDETIVTPTCAHQLN